MSSKSYDVAIVGLGAIGSSCAYQLSRRGLHVIGLDRFRPPHSQGSSHGFSRAIRMAYFEDPAYVPLLRRAYGAWRQLERDSGLCLLRQTGVLMLGSPESSVVAGSVASAREHGLAYELLDSREVARRFPPLCPESETVGLYEETGGLLAPEAAVEAQLKLAHTHGAELRFDEPIEEWKELPGRQGFEVMTGRGRYTAEQLVLAAGAWSPDLLPEAAGALRVSRQVLFWVRPTQREEAFRASEFPIWVWAPAKGPIFYGFPSATDTGPGVKLGIHTPGELVSADSVDRAVSPLDLLALRECLSGRIRWLEAAPSASSVCLYTNTPDGHFALGRHPHLPMLILATGFSGHGFKFAPWVGEAVAELILNGQTRPSIEIFDPGRPALLSL
ncbi:MAG: N-methyl-L-tryptophan oxidase [Acidobacteria bacterium]|nr:N-methyl-L-tryptophan oxidase [Acidobacteriota bacterium]